MWGSAGRMFQARGLMQRPWGGNVSGIFEEQQEASVAGAEWARWECEWGQHAWSSLCHLRTWSLPWVSHRWSLSKEGHDWPRCPSSLRLWGGVGIARQYREFCDGPDKILEPSRILMLFSPTLFPIYQLLRKRHIGNDIVTIIFQEPGALPFTPKNIRSHFQHVFIIIRAHNPCTDSVGYRYAPPTWLQGVTQGISPPHSYFLKSQKLFPACRETESEQWDSSGGGPPVFRVCVSARELFSHPLPPCKRMILSQKGA